MTVRDLREKISRLPAEPGVYLFKDGSGKVLYVGKATSLKARVRSYLRPGGDGRFLIPFLEERARDLEFIVTRSPGEALLLEDSLIKKFKPPFNIDFKDDKNYLLIRIDPSREWPGLAAVRKRKKDGALYFGPFPSAHSTRRTLSALKRVLQLRDCKESEFRNRTRPCLKYEMGMCCAPCVGLVDKEEYARRVERAVRVLKGEGLRVARALRREMEEAAERLEFEKAQVLKERAEALERICGAGVVTRGTGETRDAFGLFRAGKEVEISLLSFREGRVAGGEHFHLESELPDEEILSAALVRIYRGGRAVPEKILLHLEPNDRDALESWLSERRGKKVELLLPVRGEKARLVELARRNAERRFAARKGKEEEARLGLERLAGLLGLARRPRLVHCYDVSHTQGVSITGSRVAFLEGRPAKERYRRFQVTGMEGQDDFAALSQTVLRSLSRALREEGGLPDLVVLDGGAPQVRAVGKALEEAGLGSVPLVGIAKARPARKIKGRLHGPVPERLVLPGREGLYLLREGAPESKLLARMRDEAHRFAITYHRKLRGKSASVLDSVPGLGPARKKLLLRTFGSLQAVKEASLEDLLGLRGLPEKVARALWERLHG